MLHPGFVGKLELTPVEDDLRYQLLKTFQYITSSGEVIAVPKGYVTDLASVPRILWNILPPFGKYSEAAVIHDYLYSQGGKIASSTKLFNKLDSDKVFYEAMLLCRVNKFLARLMYFGVRIGGKGKF